MAKIDREADHFTDISGFKVNWRDPEDGWDEMKRRHLIKEHDGNIKTRAFVPALSETGALNFLPMTNVFRETFLVYKKMKIPKDVYDYLMLAKQDSVSEPEKCDSQGMHNCDRIISEIESE